MKSGFKCAFGKTIFYPEPFDVIEFCEVKSGYPRVKCSKPAAIDSLAVFVPDIINLFICCTPRIMYKSIGSGINGFTIYELYVFEDRVIHRRIMEKEEYSLDASIRRTLNVVDLCMTCTDGYHSQPFDSNTVPTPLYVKAIQSHVLMVNVDTSIICEF